MNLKFWNEGIFFHICMILFGPKNLLVEYRKHRLICFVIEPGPILSTYLTFYPTHTFRFIV